MYYELHNVYVFFMATLLRPATKRKAVLPTVRVITVCRLTGRRCNIVLCNAWPVVIPFKERPALFLSLAAAGVI